MAEARSFHAAETRFQGRYAKSLRSTIYQAYRPAFGRVVFFLAIGLIGRICLLGNANLIGYWVDSLCVGAGCRPLPSWFAGMGSAQFIPLLAWATGVGFVLTLAFRAGLSRLSAEAVSRIYDETTCRTSRLPMSFFDSNPTGRVITRFSSDYNTIFRIFGGPMAEFIGLIFDFTAMTLLLAVASPWFLPFWALLVLLNTIAYRVQLGRLRYERRETAVKRSPSIAHFAESVHGSNAIRAYGRREAFERRFSQLNDTYLLQRLSSAKVFAFFSWSMTACTAFAFLLAGLASFWLVESGRIGIGAVGVAFAYFALSNNILQAFFEWLGQFEEALSGLERMNEYMMTELEPGARLPAVAKFDTPHLRETGKPRVQPPPAVAIEIEDLWMRYRPDLPCVLNGVTLRIRAGERLAVVGRTGSGKTSLIQALFRLYPIERGAIRVGEWEANLSRFGAPDEREGTLPLSSYRRLMSYITQDPALFLGTLRENLRGPGERRTPEGDEAMIQALRRVQFLSPEATNEEYLRHLAMPIEERGRNLSAGERQLVCMARCLLQASPVVILDEATSAVDPRSEEILTRATEEFFVGKTQILIAHRLSTIRSCDRVLWLQHGKVHRLGPPSEVLPEFESAELSL